MARKQHPAHPEDAPRTQEQHEAFTQEDLSKVWDRLCEEAGNEKRFGLHTAMDSAELRLGENFTVEIAVSSSAAAHELEENMLEVLAYLRSRLHNTAITHRITVNESVRERKPYTPKEKYEYLKGKNPLLEKMREELDLNIDF